MKQNMYVVAISAFGGVGVLEDAAWPMPELKAGEVRVRVEASSFNPIDLAWREGKLGRTLPAVLGRDFAGTVDATGEGVTDMVRGDPVWGYQAGLASNGSGAEYLCLPAMLVARRPGSLSSAAAAAIPVAGLTAYKCVHEKARVTPGTSALVTGAAGGVGAMIVQLLQDAGVSPIIVTAGSDRSFAYLSDELGLNPDWILRYANLSEAELVEAVLARNGGRAPDATFDTVGGAMKSLAFNTVAVDGHVVSIVEEPADYPINLWDEATSPLSLRSLSFHFVELSAAAGLAGSESWPAYRRALDWLTAAFDSGRLRPPRVTVVGPLSADTARRAHTLLQTGHAGGKLVMTVGDNA